MWQTTETAATVGQQDNKSVSWINISAQDTWFSLYYWVSLLWASADMLEPKQVSCQWLKQDKKSASEKTGERGRQFELAPEAFTGDPD